MAFKLRPSAAATWRLCHGMPRMLEGIPPDLDDEDVEVREEGTACHWVAHELSKGVTVVVGDVAPNGVAVDDEMLVAAQSWIALVRSWGDDANPRFEQDVHCRRIHEQCGGTTDACGYSAARRVLYVGDLKYGFRFVDVRDNWQLLCYFAGVLDMYALSDLDVSVEFVIFQPRSYHRDGPVRRWRVGASELRAQVNQLAHAAERAMSATACTVTVNDGCGRCAARYRCTAAQNAALGVLDEVHKATPHDLPFEAAEDELRRLQWARDIVDARITGLESQVLHGMMRKGSISKHFDLEAKSGREVWKEGQVEQAQAVAALFGVNITKPAQVITPTQAKAKLPAFVVSMFSHRPKGAFKLVPSDASKWARIFGKYK